MYKLRMKTFFPKQERCIETSALNVILKRYHRIILVTIIIKCTTLLSSLFKLLEVLILLQITGWCFFFQLLLMIMCVSFFKASVKLSKPTIIPPNNCICVYLVNGADSLVCYSERQRGSDSWTRKMDKTFCVISFGLNIALLVCAFHRSNRHSLSFRRRKKWLVHMFACSNYHGKTTAQTTPHRQQYKTITRRRVQLKLLWE